MKSILPSLLIFMLLTILNSLAQEDSNMPLKIGDKAPDFKLKDDSGQSRTLAEFYGKKVVLYFYPKDDTPGCTKEACSFRDNYNAFEENGIVVLGISYDSPESHKNFKQKYNLPFILLSDETKKVAKAYGAYGGLTKVFFPKRITFLINEEGIICHIFEKVTVTEHAGEVLDTLLQSPKE